MKVGILADIHGNKTALEAVLHDCKKKGVTHYILLGDLFAKGSDPEGVFVLLKDLNVLASIRGNTDQWLLGKQLTSRQRAFVNYSLSVMSQRALEAVHKMQSRCLLELFGYSILMIHHYEKVSQQEISEYILTAHTHIASLKTEGNKTIFNPGSIGNPYDKNPYASYGILENGEGLDFQIVRVPYDMQQEIEIAVKNKLPYLEKYIHAVTYGCKL